jgi:hypothetical protein
MEEKEFKIESTNFTPKVEIDYEEKIAKISGRSIPEDAYDFYFLVTQKLKNVSELTLEVDLEFLNSASLRFMSYSITSELNLKCVKWYYLKDDVDIEEKGRLIKDIMNKEHPDVDFQVLEMI